MSEPTTDSERGLYRKYDVKRIGGTPGRHDECVYYVLDLMHDAYSANALAAYADACRDEYPDLAADLDKIITSGGPFRPPYAWREGSIRSAEARASLEAERDALREALQQALYGPSDEQAQIGRVCARCSRRLDDGEQHVETCPYISLAEVLDRV